MNRRIGQPEQSKETNYVRLLGIFRSARVVSRPLLAQKTGLSRATVAVLTDELLHSGLVKEAGLGTSTGGRPPMLLEFNPDAAYALGAHMYDSSWRIVLTNLDANIVHRLEVHIPDRDPQAAVKTLKAGVEKICSQVNEGRVLPAIGLGTPGLVDMRSGIIKFAPDIGWSDVPIRDMVQESLGLTTIVANRSKVGALAEFWHGATCGINNLIYVSLGTGVAAGIIHNGRLYVGANSSAGELGHMTILPNGPLCPCGNRGCLQQLMSESAITNRVRQRLREGGDSVLRDRFGVHPERITARDVFQAAEQDDDLARQVVEEATAYLGIAIANLVNLCNPDLIVLGGPIGQTGQFLLGLVRREVERRAMAYPLSATQIVTSSLGLDAGAIGASVLVLQRTGELFFQASERSQNQFSLAG